MKHDSSELITVIDIGTTKICVFVGKALQDGSVALLGFGQAASEGLARGVVVHIAPVVDALRSALREAELTVGHKLHSASIGVSGSHIKSFNSHGMVLLKHGEVRQTDIDQALNSARAIPLPEGQQLLHAVPQIFILNGHDIVKNPLGMFGVRLEVQAHLITGAVASVQNLIRCCELADINVQDVILEPIASAEAVLSPDEQEIGIGMLDIGGGTSDFAVYQRGTVRHTYIIPIAGNVFTHDIAVCLHTTLQEAERIKKNHGIADPHLLTENYPIPIASIDGSEQHSVMRSELLTVLEARTQELLSLVAHEIHHNHLKTHMPAGLVITGGGSLLTGLTNQAHDLLRIPVRRGVPQSPSQSMVMLNHPMYATGYGLLLYVAKRSHDKLCASQANSVSQRIFSRMKSWVLDIF